MTIVEQVDSISEQIQTTPLSMLLIQILPIALELNDFEGYSILSCWNKPVCKDKDANRVFFKNNSETKSGILCH